MVKPLIKLTYVGDGFLGYQAQKGTNARTVQGELNRAAREIFGFECNVTGCSRTDSGVHALAYYAAISPKFEDDIRENWCRISDEKLPLALNAHLPSDIAVLSARTVDFDFHPRYEVKQKTYVYKIHDGPIEDPFLQSRAAMVSKRFSDSDIKRMNRAASLFCGKHDFRAFMAAGSSVKSTIRCVTHAEVYRDGSGLVIFKVTADGFLYNMVRIMAGTLIGIGRSSLDQDSIEAALISGERSRAGATAPSCGLYLFDVEY